MNLLRIDLHNISKFSDYLFAISSIDECAYKLDRKI